MFSDKFSNNQLISVSKNTKNTSLRLPKEPKVTLNFCICLIVKTILVFVVYDINKNHILKSRTI